MSGQRVSATRQFADVRRAIRRMPDALQDELGSELEAFRPRLLGRMQAGVPVRKGPRQRTYRTGGETRPMGGLVSLLEAFLDRANLKIKAGLVTRIARRKGFYGYILDAGRGLRRTMSRPQARRLPGKVRVGPRQFVARYSKVYSRRISPIAPGRYDIAFGRVREWARSEIGPVLGRVYQRAVARIGWTN